MFADSTAYSDDCRYADICPYADVWRLLVADRLESGGRLQKPEPLLESAAPLSFFTDAKAEAGRAWIGGFLELVDGCQGPWFSLEVVDSWAPWAFAKGDPGKVIAALELLATLVGVRLWVPDGDAKKTSRVAIRGYTDNQSNESLLRKAMTTKFPSTLILTCKTICDLNGFDLAFCIFYIQHCNI